MTKREEIFHGNGVAPGLAVGQALRLDSHDRLVLKLLIDEQNVDEEIFRFRRAVHDSKTQLAELRKELAAKVGQEHAFVLDVHLLMLEDGSLLSEIETIIRYTRTNAEWAVRQATDRIRRAYESLEDPYFKERGGDVENVVERVLHNLSGDRPMTWEDLPGNLVIASHDFNPSMFATMDLEKVSGMVLESGGRTSHTAIMARSLSLPAVMEVGPFVSRVCAGDILLVNGHDGQVVLNPAPERIEATRDRLERVSRIWESAAVPEAGTTRTADGTPLCLMANIELPSELPGARRLGAQGIGLFRSEFVLFGHPLGFPTRHQQTEIYSLLAREMAPHPVSIRTLDAQADKVMPGMDPSLQPNPGMGLRGIRLSLLSHHMFRDQIEAILHAATEGNVEIVLPMVSAVEEVEEARSLVTEIARRVSGSSAPNAREVPLGVMIEVPAAVMAIDELCRCADFLCIGTNDLIQYMLAVDRGNPQVSHLFQPLHPSIIRALRRISDVAASRSKPVRVCGEVSSNPLYALLLVGLGYTQLSMNATAIPVISRTLSSVTVDTCREIADEALGLASTREVCEFVLAAVAPHVSMDLGPFTRDIGIASGRPSHPYVP